GISSNWVSSTFLRAMITCVSCGLADHDEDVAGVGQSHNGLHCRPQHDAGSRDVRTGHPARTFDRKFDRAQHRVYRDRELPWKDTHSPLENYVLVWPGPRFRFFERT